MINHLKEHYFILQDCLLHIVSRNIQPVDIRETLNYISKNWYFINITFSSSPFVHSEYKIESI